MSGNEYTALILAENEAEARAFAYDLDLDDLTATDDCAHVVTVCEAITNTAPARIAED